MELLEKLKQPFPETDIEWRIQSCGAKNDKPWARVLAYITSRAVMDRLDSVLGLDNWKDEYTKGPDGGVLCKLSVRVNDEWITKEDVAENTNIDPVKGGVSGALKRAAVKFGIGRYLYHLTDNFALVSDKGIYYQPANKGKNIPAFKWNPPILPNWALPGAATFEMKYVLIGYKQGYMVANNDKAVKAITEALEDGSYDKVQHMIKYCERKNGGE
jgi:hypothetical protein